MIKEVVCHLELCQLLNEEYMLATTWLKADDRDAVLSKQLLVCFNSEVHQTLSVTTMEM